MMAGYLDTQLRQRLSYLCKEMVEPRTTQDKIVSLAIVATQKSIANNPFRMLPSNVLDQIKVLARTWSPTPSALAIKQAYLYIDYNGWGHMVVNLRPDCAHFIPGPRVGLDPQRVYTRHYLLPYLVDSDIHSGEYLGRVLSDNEVVLRRMRRNPATSGTRELHSRWLEVQREMADASGMY